MLTEKKMRDRLASVIEQYKHDIRSRHTEGWADTAESQHELGYIRALYFVLGRESCKELVWVEKW